MAKYVRRRHNKDGSITKTVTYSRKGLFGRVSDTYTERIAPPKPKPKTVLKKTTCIAWVLYTIIFLVICFGGVSLNLSGTAISVCLIILTVALIAFLIWRKIVDRNNSNS